MDICCAHISRQFNDLRHQENVGLRNAHGKSESYVLLMQEMQLLHQFIEYSFSPQMVMLFFQAINADLQMEISFWPML